MSLADIVRNGVSLANQLTDSLQLPVTHRAWIGENHYGDPSYDAPTSAAGGGQLKAVVNQDVTQHTMPSGQVAEARAHLIFVQPVPVNGADGRSEPIDTRDLIVLPDGTTGPIIDIKGPYDPGTNRPYMLEVWLGTDR